MELRRLAKMMKFRDDLESAAKIFERLNSFRKLYGFKEVEWNETLCELALSRSHQLVRTRTGMMKSLYIGGAKFNLGVAFVDLASYGPIEEKDGKQVPIHRTLETSWKTIPKFSNALLDPLVRFGAISVYKSSKTACVTIFFSILFPTCFAPRRITESEEKRKTHKKKKLRNGKKSFKTGSDVLMSDSDSESADECTVSLEADDKASAKPEIHQVPLFSLPSESCELASIDMKSIEEDVSESIAEASSTGSVPLQDGTIGEHDGTSDERVCDLEIEGLPDKKST